MQFSRAISTIGIAVLLAGLAAISSRYVAIALVLLGFFFIAWGRHREGVEAWVRRLPFGITILRGLDYLTSVIAPKDERTVIVKRLIAELSDLMRQRPTQENFSDFTNAVQRTVSYQASQIQTIFGDAARDVFLDKSQALAKTQPNAINQEHGAILTNLEAFRRNLTILLTDPDRWADKD